MHANNQWQMFPMMGIELAMNALLLRFNFSAAFDGRQGWHLLAVAGSSVGLPLMTLPTGPGKWAQQESWQLGNLMLRNLEATLVMYTVWLRCHIYASEPRAWLLSYTVVTTFLNAFMTGTVLYGCWRLRQTGQPLLPARDAEDFQPAHWAAALGLLRGLQGATDLAFPLPDGSVPAHLAAASGREAALRLLQKQAPGSPSVADNKGQLPAHFAAFNGHEAVLCVLHELSPGSLSAGDNNGQLPAHRAAQNGHEATLRVLHDLAPGSLSAGSHDGFMPAHYAAQKGHGAVLRVLQELAPGSLSAGSNYGRLPAHMAALDGHEAALHVLHELAPGSLSACTHDGLVPAHYAAKAGRDAALRVLRELAPGSFNAADNKGRLLAHYAAQNRLRQLV